uniref:cytochrome c oxidase subunit III n=1 Tax=Menacanthus cornutus TaxID=1491751 RepID=UPI002000DC40|nr:cytochrome c oxidase subunit III [Menacanthus cornutus]UNZ12992.1 cytochrome c oxidase subunit III [Menacanthus cornutus]
MIIMMNKFSFPFHLVTNSPWPLFMSFSIFSNMVFTLEMLCFNKLNTWSMGISLLFTMLVMFGWMRDVIYEGYLEGYHSKKVQDGLKLGIVLFITSEVFFFISFFWSLIHLSVSVDINLDGWPPKGISTVDPMGIPFLGTLALISSGISLTWSHHNLLTKGMMEGYVRSPLEYTIYLGGAFTSLQYTEYCNCDFSINDSVYGSLFFMMTGFHGIHVILGIVFLYISLLRLVALQFSYKHHVGFEMAIWYWHFVDVVWLYLYICVYWWGK